MELMRKDANIAREVAKEAWERFPGNPDTATERAIDWMRRKIGSQQLRAAEKLAEKLISYWARRGIAEPEAIFTRGEPGFTALSRR